MKIAMILAAVFVVAKILNLRWLGEIELAFIIACSLFGFADFIHDAMDGKGFSVEAQRERSRSGRSWIKL